MPIAGCAAAGRAQACLQGRSVWPLPSIRNNELYLATLGAAEAYLVRSARLLMPDRSAPAGLPGDESRSVDVWRGELSVGDALLLVSRNMTETVGTEELKSAVLTLHPQAAVEHLHHLFVATGGAGSDGLIAVEAKEQTIARPGARPRLPWAMPTATCRAPCPSPWVARSARPCWACATASTACETASGRPCPGGAHALTRSRPRTSRAENQRRAAMGLLALVVVVFVVGLVLVLVPRGSDVSEVGQVAGSDTALGCGPRHRQPRRQPAQHRA